MYSFFLVFLLRVFKLDLKLTKLYLQDIILVCTVVVILTHLNVPSIHAVRLAVPKRTFSWEILADSNKDFTLDLIN